MKKFLTFILVLAMVMSVSSFAMAEVTLEGSGTVEAPYLVDTEEELIAAVAAGGHIRLTGAFAVVSSVTVEGIVVLDLYGQTITGTDNTSENFGLLNLLAGADLTVKDSVGGGKMTLSATINSGWNRLSAVIQNNQGKVTIEGGTLEHLGGTDMAYGIDNLTNGKGTYAETVINGGTIKSTYRGVRQFLNGVEAQNILTINGGTIEGANKSIFFHDPSIKANSGTLIVSDEATLKGDVYLFVTEDSTEWPVSVSIDADALAEGSEITTKNVPADKKVETVGGYWGITDVGTESPSVAAIKGVRYPTLAAAVAAAKDGDTITLLADCSGNGIVFPEGKFTSGLTIDFDGFTYTVDADPLAGSEGTKTQAFQILKNNTVTLKGGTLTSSKAKMLIQNYANLTLDGMTLNGENLADPAGGKYVLSNNSGRVSIKDTTINAASDGVAFDVCKYSSYTEPTVTVSGNSKINGEIEVTTTVQTNLQISGGTFSVEPEAEWIVFGKMAVKNGDKWVIETYDPGSLETKPAEGNVMSGAIDTGAMDAKEVKEIFDAKLTDEEKAKDVDIILEVKTLDETTIDNAVVAAIDNKVGEDATLIGYLDINLLKVVDYGNPEKIEELSKPIAITIELDEVVEGRTYYIIRVHDGVAERIDGTLNGNKFTFYTDRFSTYALASEKASTGSSNTSTGNGISVKYNGGNSFSTSNPAVPTGVEIDGVPVTFNGTGSNFTVGCISSDAKWVTVRWNSTTVTTNFTPDGLVECANIGIPKTGDMPFWAAVAAFFGF